MKREKRIYIWCALMAMLIMGFGLQACQDEHGGGTPTIDSVRITDPEKADSTFTVATRGAMIVIQGQNLNDAQHIYINDQEVGFNCNYNTSTHIILTIPSDLKVVGEDSTLPMEIRVETNHGTATYEFHVIAGEPRIDYYKVDLTEVEPGVFAVAPGQELSIYGDLFHEISAVGLADVDTLNIMPMRDFVVNDSCNCIKVHMPDMIYDKGVIVVEGFAGEAYYGFARSVPEPSVSGMSSDMPVIGSTVSVYGSNLMEIVGIYFGDDLAVDGKDVVTYDAQNRIDFVMPYVPEATVPLVVKTLGGSASFDGFYVFERMITDFDGHSTGQWWDWGNMRVDFDNEWWSAPNTAPSNHSGHLLGFEGVSAGWFGAHAVHGCGQVDNIDDSTPLSSIQLRFEACRMTTYPYAAWLGIKFMNQEKSDVQLVDYNSGKLVMREWMTVAVPLTDYAPVGVTTYGELKAADVIDADNFYVWTQFEEYGEYYDLYLDNFRLYVTE
ncbi:MAG: hypothetical protein K2J63_02455 [Muribaculaceae bacterium]|nr:hypothetical protein [Muribaculaceae bacterium]